MILSDYKDFPRAGRIIGIDWGLRRCGVAVSDENRSFVFVRPQIVVKDQDELVQNVLGIIAEDKISGIVIGLPLYSDGSESETTKMVRDFAKDFHDMKIIRESVEMKKGAWNPRGFERTQNVLVR